VPPIFPLIQRRGKIADAEMYHVFNMGVGMAVICSPEDVKRLRKSIPEAKPVGEVIKQKGRTRVLID
jgi:phosphoribosylformylglycinamidine cyclo-ligase